MGAQVHIGRPRKEQLKFSAIDVEESLCVVGGSSSYRWGEITLS
jgi:hypothetical protein